MKEIEFEKLFARYGGRFDFKNAGGNELLEKIIMGANNWIAHLENIHTNLIHPYIDIINDSEFNARAAKLSDYHIGINYGTIYILKDLYYRMLSNKDVLPQVGAPSEEIEKAKIYNAQLIDYNSIYISSDPNEKVQPVNVQRQFYSEILFSNSMHFLLDHEFAHISNGHLDYIGKATNEFSMSEKNINEKQNVDLFLLQTMEIDADNYATNRGMDTVFGLYKISGKLSDDLKEHYQNPVYAIHCWLFSVYCFFRLFGLGDVSVNTLLESDHPPACIRLDLICGAVKQYVIQKYPEIFNGKIDQIISEVELTVEFAFSAISEQSITPSLYQQKLSNSTALHTNKLVGNFANLKGKLKGLTMFNPIN